MAEITKLRELMKQVGLYNMAKPTVELTNGTLSNLDFLEMLLTKELQMRKDKNIYKRKKESKLPNKNFIGFDLKVSQGITQWQIDKIKTLEFLEENTNIIISGGAGVGKTHIASSIGNVAVEQGIKTYYLTLQNLLKVCELADKKSEKIMSYIKECQLIVIDEFGYTKLTEFESQTAYHTLTNLNRTKSIIIVTNKDLNTLNDMFNERLLAITILDRITENSQVIHLGGQSYRQRNSNKIF